MARFLDAALREADAVTSGEEALEAVVALLCTGRAVGWFATAAG